MQTKVANKIMGNTGVYREVIVPAGNSWREAMAVLAAAALIAILAFVRVGLLPADKGALFKQSYHRLDTGLSDAERTVYQAFLSSQNDILRLWEDGDGSWPSIEKLDQEAIPPFAADMVAGFLRDYRWTMYDRGPWVDYLGVGSREASATPSAILRIIDLHADFHPHPHPGKDYDPKQNGAVQIWLHPENGQRYAGMQLSERGWSWIVSPDDPILHIQQEPLAK